MSDSLPSQNPNELPKPFRPKPGYGIHLAICSTLLLMGIWCSSGTLAPYAATLKSPVTSEPCRYLYNLDHFHFLATFRFLDGAPRIEWFGSIYLRRILYPLLSYPLMKAYGFEFGGVATNLIVHLLTFFIFVKWVYRRFGEAAATISMWLISTYPGIMYWAGLPYNQSMIVPSSLLLMILLHSLADTASPKKVFLLALMSGVICLSYDLAPYFGIAALIVVGSKAESRVRNMILICLGFALPLAATLEIEHFFYGIPFNNDNSNIYQVIIKAYLSPGNLSKWLNLIAEAPKVFIHAFLFSNFLFLPLLFLGAIIFGYFLGIKLSNVERALLIAAFVVFLFNNLAPPYPGWQMRGLWIERLYQPVFVAYVVYSIRVISHCSLSLVYWRRVLPLFSIVIIANLLTIFGPIWGFSNLADMSYYNFYRHSLPGSLNKNLERFGRRPLGICIHSNA